MTTIARFTTPDEAHLFRTFLESYDIEAFVLDEHLIQLFWHYSNTIGGVRVVVSEGEKHEAANLYQTYVKALRGGTNCVGAPRAWLWIIIPTLILGVPWLVFGRERVEKIEEGR